jgi:hypothetical protein
MRCETWAVTLREERRLRVFENRVMNIFGCRREEVIVGKGEGKFRTGHEGPEGV